jgi:hypothetical protein
MKARVIVAAVGAVLLFVAVVYSSLCACVTLVDIAHKRLRGEIHRALDAEQAFFQHHGRFARTLDELAYVADSTVSLRLVAASDSNIAITGTSATMPDVTCSLEVTPSTRGVQALRCTP